MSEQEDTPNVGTPGHVDHATTAPPEITIKDLVTQEVQRLVLVSRHYQAIIKESKTSTKKDFYLKKLRKNNNKLADMIVRLEQIDQMGDTSG